MGQNFLYINPIMAEKLGIEDLDWVWVESRTSKIRVQCKLSNATELNTVWTWNGMGKMAGAWNLDENADEAKKGFLLNHLIAEELNAADGAGLVDDVGVQAHLADVVEQRGERGQRAVHQTSNRESDLLGDTEQQPELRARERARDGDHHTVRIDDKAEERDAMRRRLKDLDSDPEQVKREYESRVLEPRVEVPGFRVAQYIRPLEDVGGDVVWHRRYEDGATKRSTVRASFRIEKPSSLPLVSPASTSSKALRTA